MMRFFHLRMMEISGEAAFRIFAAGEFTLVIT